MYDPQPIPSPAAPPERGQTRAIKSESDPTEVAPEPLQREAKRKEVYTELV